MSGAKKVTQETSKPHELRLATYLCPAVPVEYFELICSYLEARLDVFASLRYESRWDGPPLDRPDPFRNSIDIAFMNVSSYLSLLDRKNESMAALLPLSPIYRHSKGDGKPGYFADVIVHQDLKDKTKEFLDLRGCKWAYSRPTSFSGYLVTLRQLKLLGENPSFFGNHLQSGSHMKSIEMVLGKQADASAVDANSLTEYLKRHPEAKDDLFVLDSWGPLPPYPIVINKNLPAAFQSQLVEAFLSMTNDAVYKKALDEFGVVGFAKLDPYVYEAEKDLIKNAKGLSLDTVYY